jgi:GNAT superfamily N-acetyltransferase
MASPSSSPSPPPLSKYTLKTYKSEARKGWKKLGLAADPEPSLEAQFAALPRDRFFPDRAQGEVFWDGTNAAVGLTTRHVRTVAGGSTSLKKTFDVRKIIVVDNLQRKGRATAFMQKAMVWAAAKGRVVFVESVLSESLARILERLGFIRQDWGWAPGAPFDGGESFVFEAGAGGGGGGGVAAAGAGAGSGPCGK